MPTNKPPSRKTHISRIFGTNKKGERLDDIYADVERIDSAESAMQVPPRDQWQAVKRKLLWCDDPDQDNYDPKGNPSRKTEVLKVCDPETTSDVNDPDEWIPWRVIKQVKAVASGTRDQGQASVDNFLNKVINEELRTGRKVKVRRVVHYDTNIDEAAQKALDADPERKEYVVSSEFYTKDLASKDKDQYVEYEIVETVQHSGNSSGVNGQARQTKLLNDYLIEESEEATQKIVGEGDINPPYRGDPFQNIVNINWGGVAVEFFDRESYIELSTPVPSVKKGLGVQWFRVPQKTLDAVRAEFLAWKADNDAHGPIPRPPLCGIIPIRVFGPPTRVKGHDFPLRSTGTFPATGDYSWSDGTAGCVGAGWVLIPGTDHPAHPNMASHYVFNGTTSDADPSYIGIDCTGDYPQLSVNFVMPSDSTATFEGSWPVEAAFSCTTSEIRTRSGAGSCPGAPSYYSAPGHPSCMSPVGDGFDVFTSTTTYEPAADVILGGRPETFRNLPLGRVEPSAVDSSDRSYNGPRVTGDHWHCVAFSHDFSRQVITKGVNQVDGAGGTATAETAGSRTTNAPRLYLAFDDVNLTKANLSAYWPTGYSDPNGVLSVNGYFVACDTTFTATSGPHDDCFGNSVTIAQVQQRPSYQYTPAALSLHDWPFAFPASARYLNAIRHVEMGEGLYFTDVIGDLSDLDLRRAIINEDGKPAPMKALAEFIGKDPEVKLHGSANWKKGRNTGTLALSPPEDGTFVGRIKTYKPNPSLRGDQGR
jgi:hypothetical protein